MRIEHDTTKALLLRVGIDKGSGGDYGPVFEDSSFEFIPIPEKNPKRIVNPQTFSQIYGRQRQPFSYYVPKLKDAIPHFDPEFETFTYGDSTPKRRSLLKLHKGDYLVFYGGLKPWGHILLPQGLYFFGYLVVEEVIFFGQLEDAERKKKANEVQKNAHIARKNPAWNDLVIIKGSKQSRLLTKAYMISTRGTDRAGRPLLILSKGMENRTGLSGSIQRSSPRWVKTEKAPSFVKWVNKLP